MALKRKTKVTDSFSMASMTDVIFLLLIFFLVTSTIVAPNVIKVSLPSAAASTADNPDAYVAIHADESVPYSAVVKGINIASKLNLKVVLATKIEAN